MTDDRQTKLRLEIAHVLFLDIVGYSKLLIDEQAEALQELNEIVLNTDAAREAEASNQLIRLPTGDGMALVFTGTVEMPVECALQISQVLRAKPTLPVRMGIHSGPVHHVADVNQRENIAGAGINIAQRVMDCGDGGHILISKRVADDLAQYRKWQPYLHPLGDCEVKHGEKISVVNIYAEGVGNPEPPEKFRIVRQAPLAEKAVSPRKSGLLALGILAIGLLLISLAIVAVIFAPAAIKSFSQSRAAATPNSSISAAPAIPEKSIAVLPFENLSDDKQNAYFADGIQDEILTKLASIADLKVISRTSTAKYKSKPEDLKTVSKQLGVAKVLEGTVQKAADKVRVNVQLIDARSDSHLWARSFDGNAGEIFAVEANVAQEVADSLQAKLSTAEASQISTAPTRNPAAYDLLLKGDYERRLAQSSLNPESFDQAAAWYQQAITRDSRFALAMARFVEVRMFRHWFIEPFTEMELAEVKRLAEQALTLEPNLAAAHIALGTYYYYGYRRYEEGLAEFARAVQLQPNNSEGLAYLGYIHRRQGRLQLSLEELTKALEQDPRNASLAENRADIYCQTREWTKAQSALRAAVAIDPREVLGMRGLLLSIVNANGDIPEALRVLASYPSDSKLIVNSNIGDVTGVTGERAYMFVLARDYQTALKIWESAPVASAVDERRQIAARVAIQVIAGDLPSAQADAERARPLLEQRLRDRPDDVLTRTELSWVCLALKRHADAMKLTQQSAALLPPDKDLLTGNHILGGQAMIASQTGAAPAAVAILTRILAVPAGQAASIARLKIDPVWDPIRNDPEFQQLLMMNEHIGP
jgi:TolB-like protein/class 3 adenylate cyclase